MTASADLVRACLALAMAVLFASVIPAAASGPLHGALRPSVARAPTLPKSSSVPVVLAARAGRDGDHTRFVVELSDPVKVHVFTLSNPNRLVIDMPEVLWKLDGTPARGLGAIRTWRYGLFRPGDARFVLDLDEPVRMAEPMVLPPMDGYGYRLVLDLYPTTSAAFARAAGWPADIKAREEAAAIMAGTKPASEPAVAANRNGGTSRVVVIDPGHGGIDSGTIGATGIEEKNVVLDVGLRLAKDLKARGYTVYMTRSTDVFVPLYSRAPFARSKGADLFISLHADSNPDPKVSGASIYTLSEKGSDTEASALAHKENQSDILAGVDLSGDNSSVASILIDLAQRDTMNRSARFAHAALRDLGGATDILPRDPLRSANFVVLRSPSVPAVLIETGYLSNLADCHQMATSRWRNAVASAIAGAVDLYFAPERRQPPVAARSQTSRLTPAEE